MTSYSDPVDFDASYKDWVSYITDTRTLVQLTKQGIGRLKSQVQLGEALDLGDAFMKGAEKTAKDAQKEIDAGFPALHAHSLLGAWGATERWIEDVFVAALEHDPELLASDYFSKIKLPVSKILAPSSDATDAILSEVSRSLGAESKIGVSQFESLLKIVRLDGPIPAKAKESVLLAQQIRHVWAHRGGVADARFVKYCPSRAAVGEKLNVGTEEFNFLLNGIALYGLVVYNRYQANRGVTYTTPNLPTGFEGAWEEIGMAEGNPPASR